MKRSGFIKRKTRLKKKRTTKLSTAKRRAWAALSAYIVKRDALPDDHMTARCYTCGRQGPTEGKNRIQAGHLFAGRCGDNLWNEKAIKAQCYYCNIILNGNHAVYEQKYIDEYGQDALDEARRLALVPGQDRTAETYLEMEADYIRRRQIEVDKRLGNRIH